MNFFKGILYNIRGIRFSIGNVKLLFLGLVRLATIILITLLVISFILAYHQQTMGFIWTKPENVWVLWIWYILSWTVSMFLAALATLFAYLISQILFSIVIMDYMSKITERIITGHIKEPEKMIIWRLFFYLIKQEIPRTFIPVLISVLIMILGWFTPLGPVLMLVSSCIAIIFLAWDNTDLTPARRMISFKIRFLYLLKTIPFHLGFGLPFLIPGLNFLFLSFAPVGATIYYLEKHDKEK